MESRYLGHPADKLACSHAFAGSATALLQLTHPTPLSSQRPTCPLQVPGNSPLIISYRVGSTGYRRTVQDDLGEIFGGADEILLPYLDSLYKETLDTSDQTMFTDLTRHMENEFTDDMNPEDIEKWTAQVIAWERDPSEEDPYFVAPSGTSCISMSAVQTTNTRARRSNRVPDSCSTRRRRREEGS